MTAATDRKVKRLSKADDMSEAPEMTEADRFAEMGETGLIHWSGRIDEEWLRELKDVRKYKTLREMRDNDPIIGAIMFAVDMLIRQVNWRVEAGGADETDEEAAEFLESCLEDMSQSFENLITEILSFLTYGFSYHEIVYKRRLGDNEDPSKRSKFNDGLIGWRKMPIRSQDSLDTWVIDEDGSVKGFNQNKPSDGQLATIPIEKALLFRTTSHKGSPEGKPVIRNAFRPWFFKKRIEEIEGIGVERDLAGLPVIYAPAKIMSSNASEADQAIYTTLKKIVRNIRRDEQEGIVMPGDYDDKGHRIYELSLLSTGGTRQFNTNEIINRYDQRIAMVVMADFILLGHEKVGSFALSDNKTSLFATAIGAWLDEIAAVFNTYAIPRLFKLNGINLEKLPYLVHDDIETPDLKELGEYISKLSGAGAPLFPDEELENYLREAANLPLKPEEDEFNQPAQTMQPAKQPPEEIPMPDEGEETENPAGEGETE